jgi:hypothetical protein
LKTVLRVLLGTGLTLASVGVAAAQSYLFEPNGAVRPVAYKAVTSPEEWETFKLGVTDVFSIAMPGAPESKSESLSSEGFVMKANFYTTSTDEIFVSIVDMHDLPLKVDEVSDETRTFLFTKVRDGLIEGITTALEKNGKKLEIKFAAQKNVSLKSLNGYEQDLTIGTIKGRARMLSRADHIYIFFTLVRVEANENLMNKFLDSFEYLGNEPELPRTKSSSGLML